MTKDEITTPLRDGNTIKLPREQEKNEWND